MTIPKAHDAHGAHDAHANAGEPYIIASTSGVKTRKGPGTDYAQLGALGLGSVATITKKSPDGEWGYAAAAQLGDGSWGTTSDVWINLDPCVKGTPTKWVSATGSSNLNVRKAADVNAPIWGKLPNGTSMTVAAIEKNGDYTWGFVAYAKEPGGTYHMREGWAALEYCKKVG